MDFDEAVRRDQALKAAKATSKRAGGADAQRTAYRKALIEAGVHPATKLGLLEGDKTCGDCVFSLPVHHRTKTYWKCEKAGLSHGAGTDIRKSWPACTAFEERPDE